MITATNPITGDSFELPGNTQVSEIVTDPNDGNMFEVVSIEDGQAELSEVTIEEDWGQ
jgi:lysine biosynthesis protein LysW